MFQMMTPAEKAEVRERHMAVLAERALLLACDLQEAAMATDDPDQKARLAGAFQKVSRGLRQTHYLDARLDRELARQAQEDRAQAAKADEARRKARKDHVRSAVEHAIWLEYDDDEMQELVQALDRLLNETAHEAGFLDAPVEIHIASVTASIGVGRADPVPTEEAAAPAVPRDPAPEGQPIDWSTFDDPPRRSPG